MKLQYAQFFSFVFVELKALCISESGCGLHKSIVPSVFDDRRKAHSDGLGYEVTDQQAK